MSLPKLPQAIQDRSRQRHEPLPVALADDAKLHIDAVDAPTSKVAASLMRKPQAYMRAKQAL